MSVCLSGYTFPHFSTDPLQDWWEHSMGHDTYHGLCIVCVHAMCARARACVHLLIFGRNISKIAENMLRISTSCTYVSCSRTACACASERVRERACARASVVKLSLILGRIVSKFGKNILRGTTNCMGYVLFIFTHTLVGVLVGTYFRSSEVTWAPRHGLFNLCLNACANSARQ
jgi:hypothetical protein